MGIFASSAPNVIASQIFGAIGIVISLFIYAAKTRSKIITCKFIADIIWMLNYALIGAYTAALINVIGMARETVFYNRGSKKWASYRWWLYVFVAFTFLSPILEFVGKGAFSFIPLIPATGSVFAVISFYSMKTRNMRILGIFAQLLWTLYGIIVFNPTALISSILTIVSIVIGAIRDMQDNKAKAKIQESK